jgi:hypothetical protein
LDYADDQAAGKELELRIKRVPEAWGVWEKRNGALAHHWLNKIEPNYIHDAYCNLVMSVQVSTHATEWGEITHLWIRRHDEKPTIWRDMQRVKNELVGRDRVGIEVFPPADEVIDEANIYHVWVFPEGFRLPLSIQRPQKESHN